MVLKKGFCEIFVRRYLTAVRVAIAKELIESFGYSQLEAARAVGMSQSLLNYILHGRRRNTYYMRIVENDGVRRWIQEFAKMLAEGKEVPLCSFCAIIAGCEETSRSRPDDQNCGV